MTMVFSLWKLLALLIIPVLPQLTIAALASSSVSANQLSTVADSHEPSNLWTNQVRTLVRYKAKIPLSIGHSVEEASVLASVHREGFMIPVSVGASTLHLSVDTGSSDLSVRFNLLGR